MKNKRMVDTNGIKSFWDKYKWYIIAFAAIVLIVIIAVIIYFVVFKKEAFRKKEGFVATDSFKDQQDYANSYIMSVLGGSVSGIENVENENDVVKSEGDVAAENASTTTTKDNVNGAIEGVTVNTTNPEAAQ